MSRAVPLRKESPGPDPRDIALTPAPPLPAPISQWGPPPKTRGADHARRPRRREALDLAAGLRVVRPGVAEDHAAGAQGRFEGDLAVAAVTAGEHRAVVGEPPDRVTVQGAAGGPGVVRRHDPADSVGAAGSGSGCPPPRHESGASGRVSREGPRGAQRGHRGRSLSWGRATPSGRGSRRAACCPARPADEGPAGDGTAALCRCRRQMQRLGHRPDAAGGRGDIEAASTVPGGGAGRRG
jgi:hypothetical protein